MGGDEAASWEWSDRAAGKPGGGHGGIEGIRFFPFTEDGAQFHRLLALPDEVKGNYDDSVREAQRRYPHIGRVSDDQAEAILLALWGLGQVNGVPPVLEVDPLAVAA